MSVGLYAKEWGEEYVHAWDESENETRLANALSAT